MLNIEFNDPMVLKFERVPAKPQPAKPDFEKGNWQPRSPYAALVKGEWDAQDQATTPQPKPQAQDLRDGLKAGDLLMGWCPVTKQYHWVKFCGKGGALGGVTGTFAANPGSAVYRFADWYVADAQDRAAFYDETEGITAASREADGWLTGKPSEPGVYLTTYDGCEYSENEEKGKGESFCRWDGLNWCLDSGSRDAAIGYDAPSYVQKRRYKVLAK